MSKERRAKYSRRRRAKVQLKRIIKDGKWYHPDAPHGTSYGYVTYGCRCDACREAHNEYMRDYYKKNKD